MTNCNVVLVSRFATTQEQSLSICIAQGIQTKQCANQITTNTVGQNKWSGDSITKDHCALISGPYSKAIKI